MYSGSSKLYPVSLISLLWIASLGGLNSQSISQGPVNSAARHGDSSVLHCTVDRAGDTVMWTFHANGTSDIGERLYLYDDTHEQKPNSNYDVDSAGLTSGVVDLLMLESSVATAGRYTCSLLYTEVHATAQFVSVAPVTCDPPPGEKTVQEGATVILTCDVTYIGYQPPSLVWLAADSTAPLQGDWTWTNEHSTLSVNVTAEPDLDMLDFTCDLGFMDSVDAGPPPVYNDSCTTHFMVLHGATRIEIVPDPDGVVSVVVGDSINCTASGRPPPAFSWEGDGGEFVMGSILTVMEEWTDLQKAFTCFARNDINGQPAEASLPIEIFVSNPEPPPVTTQGGVEPWVIAIAVIVPILIIGAIVGIVFFLKHKKKKKKQKATDLSQLPDGSMPIVTMMPDPRAVGGRPSDPGPPRGRPPPGQKQNGVRSGPPTNLRYQNAALMAGMPVPITPGADTEQNKRVGGDSPGYGDLGIKQFSSSHSGGLDASSIDLDPGPRYGQRHGSRSSLEVSQGFGGSQHSMSLPPPMHPPPPLDQAPQRPSGMTPLGNHPMDVLHNQSMASQGVTQNTYNMALQQMSANGQMGSQHSLGHIQPAARGMMGSRGSLASQGSRQLDNNLYELPPDAPDTEV